MTKVKNVIPYIVAMAVCGFVAFPVVSNSVVLDEAYSILLVRGSVPEIIKGTAVDVHPPLYYLILKLTSLFVGESLVWYRIVTALATWLNLLILGATFIRKRWGWRVSVIYILWFGLTYSTLEKSSLVRMYSWAAFFVTATALFLFAYYEKRSMKSLALGILMTLGAMYTHYYAVLAVFVIWVMLLAAFWLRREKVWGILLGGVIVTVGYLPWLGVLLTQFRNVAEDYWISSFDWAEWAGVVAYLMEASDSEPSGIGMVLFVLILLLLVPALIRKKWDALCCIGVFFGTMLLAAVISVAVTPIWMTRYMYVAWGMVALFVAITMGEAVSRYSGLVQSILLLVLAIAGVSSFNMMMEDETMDNSADEWVDFLQQNVEADAGIVFDDSSEHSLVYLYYMPDVKLICTSEFRKNGGVDETLKNWLSENSGRQLWFLINYRQGPFGTEAMEKTFRSLGYSMEKKGAFVIKQKTLEMFRVEVIR